LFIVKTCHPERGRRSVILSGVEGRSLRDLCPICNAVCQSSGASLSIYNILYNWLCANKVGNFGKNGIPVISVNSNRWFIVLTFVLLFQIYILLFLLFYFQI